MASNSTSSIRKSFKYDVFLSFRGEDTRKNFVDHLYAALEQEKIYTYKDDERIKKGKRISDELIGSIEDSKIYIIIFSKNYASSSWCLDELVKIMECQKTNEHTAYPVFYDVEPTQVRNQTGAVGEAFARHEKEEAAQKWRDALKEAADLAGRELKNTVDGHEAKFIRKIIEDISPELPSCDLIIDENLVGMETRINKVVSFLEIGFDDVRMIGIKGMGGSGKTTLARAVFNQIHSKFEGCSFLENVRENSTRSPNLESLQEQVLSNVVLNAHPNSMKNVDMNRLMKQMSSTRALVVLDDVDDIKQLMALAGKPNSLFGKGSRIIITTRDEQVLLTHKVKLIYNVSLLSDEEAICLFSRHAYRRDIPSEEHKVMLRKVLDYAKGLPLTIKVLGSDLCDKNERGWKETLRELETIPLKETSKILELSYSGLEEDYKEMFLDVVCLLKGETKDYAIEALKSCQDHANKIDLEVLEKKSLITFYKNSMGDECVGMHDHIEEMGWNIVRGSHPDKPNQHSRLWIDDEIEHILANDLGTDETRCIQLLTKKLDPEIVMQGLRRMTKLRFLDVGVEKISTRASIFDHFPWNWKFNKVSPYFPNTLRYLRWKYYPFGSLPRTFQGNDLVSLEIAYSEIVQLWEGGEKKVLNKLKFLDIYNSRLRTLDLGLTPNLEKLSLGGYNALVELHMRVGCLKLIYVNISCPKLRILDLWSAVNLELLVVTNCYDLVELQMPGKCLALRSFHVSNSKLTTIHLNSASNLEMLKIVECESLVELKMAGECQKLAYLNISRSKLRTFNLRLTPNLESLDLSNCSNLIELKTSVGCLKKLVYLNLSGCSRFSSFLFPINGDHTSGGSVVDPSAELHLIAKSVEKCPLHPENNLPKFQFECYYKNRNSSPLSLSINLEKLISFGLCVCTNLKIFSRSICGLRYLRKLRLQGSFAEVPKYLDLIECLEEVSLVSTYIEHLPDSILMLKHLKSLELDSCMLLKKLPEDIDRLKCLEKLYLIDCKFLRDIPNSICNLKSLQLLCIEDAGISHLPRNITLLKGLHIYGSRELLESLGSTYTSKIKTSEDQWSCYIDL